jgi:chorismate mutase/prephenate dehydratase
VNTAREIHELRQEIAQADAQLVALLDKRARAARRIGQLRKEHPPTLPATDASALRELIASSAGEMPAAPLKEILTAVFAACLALELPVNVAFVAPEGGLTHAAAASRFGQTALLRASESIPKALEEVSRRGAEFAVVPFETATESPVQSTIAALLASDLRVVEVLDVPVDLHLLGRAARLTDVRTIRATAADRSACESFLEGLEPGRSVVDAVSPLAACQSALEDPTSAAIASEQLGSNLGLPTIRASILDRGGTRIRYAVVGARPSSRTGGDVTLFVFGVDDAPGSFVDVLKVFADRGLNLKKLQSHPVSAETWKYLFCGETAGHFTDRGLVGAFEEIKRMARFFKLLGSYPG